MQASERSGSSSGRSHSSFPPRIRSAWLFTLCEENIAFPTCPRDPEQIFQFSKERRRKDSAKNECSACNKVGKEAIMPLKTLVIRRASRVMTEGRVNDREPGE